MRPRTPAPLPSRFGSKREIEGDKSVQGILGHLDVLEDRLGQLARGQRVLSEATKGRARSALLALLLALLFGLHWVAFSVRTRLGSIEHALAISLAVSALIWLAMLAPAVQVSIKRRDAAKRRAQEARRNRESRPHETSHPDVLGVHVDQLERSSSCLAYFQRACRALVAPGMARLRLMQLEELAMRIHATPEFWVARLVRHLFYAGCYVGSTMYLLERTEEGEWLFDRVPPFFYFVNFVSLWTNYFDYATDLAMGGWPYFFSLNSLLELLTMPPFILANYGVIAGLRSLPVSIPHMGEVQTVGETWNLNRISPEPLHYLIQYGYLRFLAATQVNNVVLKRLRIRSIRLRVASLILTVVCIIMVIGGAMFLLEARLNGDDNFVNYGDFLYFAVVTASTVGYGDFSPTTPLSRIVIVLAILSTIITIPEQVNRLQEAMAEEPVSMGTPPRSGEPFILLCGRVTPWQLTVFVRNVENVLKDEYHRPPSKIVVLSLLPIRTYAESAAISAQPSIFFYRGDLLTTRKIGTARSPIDLHDATHAFVYGGTLEKADDDVAAILRVLALLNFMPAWAITCMIHRSTNLTLTFNMGVWSTLCINDLQMRWVAKSLTDTPGIICLMANLLVTQSEITSKAKVQTAFEADIKAGVTGASAATAGAAPPSEGVGGKVIRRLVGAGRDSANATDPAVRTLAQPAPGERAPPASAAADAAHVAGAAHRPPALPTPSHDEDLAAYLLGAESELLVDRLPSWAIGKPARWLYDLCARVESISLLAVSDSYAMHIFRPEVRLTSNMQGVYLTRSEALLSALLALPAPPFGGQPAPLLPPSGASVEPPAPKRYAMPRMLPHRRHSGAPEPAQLGEEEDAAGRAPSARPRGRPAGAPAQQTFDVATEMTRTELNALMRGDRIVVLGAPADVGKMLTFVLDERRATERYLRVVHICHSPFKGLDALKARLNRVRRGATARYQFIEADPLDHEVLKRHVLAPGLYSVVVFHDNLRREGEHRMDAAVAAAKIESMLLNRGANRVRVIVAMASTADMRFVERSSWWPSSGDAVSGHMTSPTYSAGHVFADEMVYPLMMSWRKQGLITFCRNLTDNLLDPVDLKLFDLPEHLRRRAEPSAFRYDSTPDAPPPLRAELERVLTYGELRAELLKMGMLALGLYRHRSVQISSDKVLRVLPYVFTNPPNSARVRDNDRVYALMQTDRNANGLSGRTMEEAARKIQSQFRNMRATHWTRARVAEFERDGIFTPTNAGRGILSNIGRGLRQAINRPMM